MSKDKGLYIIIKCSDKLTCMEDKYVQTVAKVYVENIHRGCLPIVVIRFRWGKIFRSLRLVFKTGGCNDVYQTMDSSTSGLNWPLYIYLWCIHFQK